jgi:hypothetical protein
MRQFEMRPSEELTKQLHVKDEQLKTKDEQIEKLIALLAEKKK